MLVGGRGGTVHSVRMEEHIAGCCTGGKAAVPATTALMAMLYNCWVAAIST